MTITKGLFMGGVLCLLIGCGGEEGAATAGEDSAPEPGDPVVVEVQQKLYTRTDFERYITLIAGETAPDLGPDTRSRLFDHFLEEKLLLAEAFNRDLSLTQQEKRNFLAKLKFRFEEDEKADSWEDIDTSSLFDRLLVEKLTVELVKDISVSDEEVDAYYEQHKRDFLQPERVRVSQILLDTEDKAVEVLESLQGASEAEFRRIASEQSQGMEAERGGEMGGFQLGQLPSEMERVIFALQPGEISQVLESSYGFHIFRLDEKSTADLIPREEAALEIEVRILDEKIKAFMHTYVGTLRNRLEWTAYTHKLGFSYQRNQDV
jgi:parvulin-like peptidyl-prolyl isomerase